MTESQIPWSSTTKYFKIVCRLAVNGSDSSADEDFFPDLRTGRGSVTIKSSVERFRYIDDSGLARQVFNKNVTYQIQPSTGELFDSDGSFGVYLLNTSSSGISPQGFTYLATIAPELGESWDVEFSGDPNSDVIDLSLLPKLVKSADPKSIIDAYLNQDSILITIKKMLGINEADKAFDTDVIIHINSAIMDLTQLGVGPSTGFYVRSITDLWLDFLGDRYDLESVKTYVYLKVRILFDPPTTSFTIDAIKQEIAKMEWRLNVQAERTVV